MTIYYSLPCAFWHSPAARSAFHGKLSVRLFHHRRPFQLRYRRNRALNLRYDAASSCSIVALGSSYARAMLPTSHRAHYRFRPPWLSEWLSNRFDDLKKVGAPGGIRTPNPQIRSLMLCPVELRAPSRCDV